MLNIMAEWVEHHGEHYLRIDPQMVDFAGAGTVHKVTEDFAVHTNAPIDNVSTTIHGHVETVNDARAGDWIVYNTGNIDPNSIPGYTNMSVEEKILSRAERAECYILDDATFRSTHETPRSLAHGVLAAPKSEPRHAMTLPFNAVFTAPWGKDAFIKAGGYIVRNNDKVYGIEQSTMHHTFGAINETKPFIETHRAQIMARTPLVPEVVFKPEIASVYEAALASQRSKND